MKSLDSTLPGFGKSGPTEDAESVNARMVALMRCLLIAAGLIVASVVPLQAGRYSTLAYASLAAYGVYAAVLALSIWRGHPLVSARASHWIDVVSYAWIIYLTEGASSIFFPFFFFSCLVASFAFGFREGLLVTAVSAVLFMIVGVMAPAPASGFELDRALIRPMILFLLGYMIAYWGGHELALRRRLRLLRKVSRSANPRLGIDHTVIESLRRLVEFFNAELGILVRAQADGAPYLIYRIQARAAQHQAGPESVSESTARLLLEVPADAAVTADLLGAPRFITAPYKEQEGPAGRLYIAGKRAFGAAEAEFLAHVGEQIAAAIDNLRLLDRLMINAAQLERARIARDIHDTTVQPYIGLRLGLEALQRRLPADSDLAQAVRELVEMSSSAVDDVRGYVSRLRNTQMVVRGEQLMDGLLEQVGRYRNFYAIDVELRGEPRLALSDRIAGEAYQIICEALANIYKHTRARSAYVDLRREGETLRIEVGNGREPGAQAPFTPRSIVERARALGGMAQIRLDAEGHDVVAVRIPL